MLKLVIKILLFAVLFALGLNFTDDFFKEKRISKYSRDAYLKLDRNVDIAIFGSSHGLNGLDPRFLQKELGKTTFNFCTAGQKIVSTMPVIDEVLGDQNVELAIVDIFYGTVRNLRKLEKKTKFFQYNTLDNIDFSIPKLKAHNTIFGIHEFYNMSPTLRRHQNWIDIPAKKQYIPDISSDINNGYFSRFFFRKEIWDKSITKTTNNKGRDVIIDSLNTDEKENIDLLIEKFKSNKVPVLFVSTPFFQDSLGLRSVTHQNLIIDYIKSKDADIIDFNALWKKFNFTQEDFIDVDHLNTKGALKISTYLAEYVVANYTFNKERLKEADLIQNRYAIIDRDLDGIIHNQSFDSISPIAQKNIGKVFFYHTFDDRYEILFEGTSGEFDAMVLKYEYQYDSAEAHKITKFQQRFINDKGIVSQQRKFDHEISYNGKKYQVFQFNCVFEKLIKFKLLLISGKEQLEILKFDELKLRNGNR